MAGESPDGKPANGRKRPRPTGRVEEPARRRVQSTDLQPSPHNSSRGQPGQRLLAFCLCLWLARGGALAADNPSAWPFTKPAPVSPPSVKNKSWPRTPVDAFILAKLEAAKLAPAPPAEPRVLIRRITFDLTGLPPTPEEVASFERACSSGNRQSAIANLVDRLLASPRYGERWGRHWLDVVRYADSLDSRGSGKEGDILDAWRYRDWVVDAFNRDLPYDQFILHQVAGDILANAPAPRRQTPDPSLIIPTALYAIGHWGNGDSDKMKVHTDIVDDQVDVTSRAFLGLTLSCARCHDHKFDPLTQRDYYAMAGFFFSSRILAKFASPTAGESIMRVSVAAPAEQAARDELLKRIAAIEAKLAGGLTPLSVVKRDIAGKPGLLAWNPKGADNPSLVINTTDAEVKFITITLPARAICLHPGPKQPVTAAWRSPLAGRVKVSAKLRDVDPNCGDGITWAVKRGSEVLAKGEMNNGGAAEFPEREITVAVGDLVQVTIGPRKEYTCDSTQLDFTVRADDGRAWSLADALVKGATQGQDNLWWVCAGEGDRLGSDQADFAALEDERKRLTAELKPLPMTHGLQEGGIPQTAYAGFRDAPLHQRGDYHRLGDAVPRGVPAVIAGTQPVRVTDGSGRLELAKWIASPANPLTARVMVNRIWQHHFGEGLVRTANNFGKLGTPPTHPELLDWLAAEFIKSGWSVKAMHRLMLNSAAYQQAASVQSSVISNQSKRIPPGTASKSAAPLNTVSLNTDYCSPFPRRRLSAEEFRDALLFTAGTLDLQAGGPPVRELAAPRRTLYVSTVRSDRTTFQMLFDGADPTSIVERRNESTVAPQALWVMNHPFPQAQAQALARRARATAPDLTGRVRWLHAALYAREPHARELDLARRILAADDDAAWHGYAQVLLSANEFLYLD
jgi:hypothetical protein